MVSRLTTFAFHGVDARHVDVQVQLTNGSNPFTIVGLPDKAVSEARERVRSALYAIGLGLPAKRITVNLAPADLPKEGSHFDLAIALGLLMETGAIPRDACDGFAVMGELSLDGSIAPVAGALPAAITANAHGLGLICPAACGPEAAWAGSDTCVLAPESLIRLVNHFKGVQVLAPAEQGILATPDSIPDLADVKGQETARRALEIAAAGGHHLLMTGPPGAGKSMLAARMPGILPPLEPSAMLEISMVQSLAGMIEGGTLTRTRPFRAPHHSASMAALVGGGMRARPGEVSLAHNGVLFLDELPEFQAPVLDSLRQPMETGDVLIARANFHVRYPARFQLVAAMNPCRCGYGRSNGQTCRYGENCEVKYRARISGPLLDRIDLSVTLAAVSPADIGAGTPGEPTAAVAGRVARAHAMQTARSGRANASLDDSTLSKEVRPDEKGSALLRQATAMFNLSARAYMRILRVARTLADLDGTDALHRRHIAEAISFRLPAAGPFSSAERIP